MRRVVRGAFASRAGWSTWCSLRRSRGVIVLMYHRIGTTADGIAGLDAAHFRSHMEWLREHCSPIAPEEFRSFAAAPRRRRPAVLVTFDDGYRDYAELAHPVLARLGIPALVFLATAYVDDPWRMFWWDALRRGVELVSAADVALPWQPGTPVPLRNLDERDRFLRLVKRHLKQVPDDTKEALVQELLGRMGVSPAALRSERRMMTWDEVRAVSGLTRWGGHTVSHPILSQVDEVRVDAEILGCRQRILEETRNAPRYFAYPNGRAMDFDDRTRAALRRHGFDLAFSTIEGVNGPDTDWLAVRRYPGLGTCADLAWQMSGLAAQ